MPTFSVIAPRGPSTSTSRFQIRSSNGALVYSPSYAPLAMTYGGNALSFANITRPGRKPITAATNFNSKTLSFKLVIANKAVNNNGGYGGKHISWLSVDDQLNVLEQLGASESPLIVEYEPRTAGNWVITALTYESVNRDPVTNQVTRAEVSIEMMEYVNFTAAVTAVPALPAAYVEPAPVASPTPSPGAATPATYKLYKVKKGDTLPKLAKKFYNNKNKWKKIANANGIKKASAKLRIGRVLKIPK